MTDTILQPKEQDSMTGFTPELDRLIAWCRAKDPAATIWLHAAEAKNLIVQLSDALERIASIEFDGAPRCYVEHEVLRIANAALAKARRRA